MSNFDKLVENIIFKESVAKVLKFQDGTEISLDINNNPIGYEHFATYSPGSSSELPPESFGESYRVYSPRSSGYEIYAYPAVKQFIKQWTE